VPPSIQTVRYGVPFTRMGPAGEALVRGADDGGNRRAARPARYPAGRGGRKCFGRPGRDAKRAGGMLPPDPVRLDARARSGRRAVAALADAVPTRPVRVALLEARRPAGGRGTRPCRRCRRGRCGQRLAASESERRRDGRNAHRMNDLSHASLRERVATAAAPRGQYGGNSCGQALPPYGAVRRTVDGACGSRGTLGAIVVSGSECRIRPTDGRNPPRPAWRAGVSSYPK
jgi:hypothetical protein